MNRLVLGILLNIAFGVVDVLMMLRGNHPDRTTAVLLQAFSSRFAIGFLAAGGEGDGERIYIRGGATEGT